MKLNILKKTVEELSSNPKQTFLMDLVGAIITAFFTGIVLVYFHDCFGMPKKALYVLSSLACFFALYSGINFICFDKNKAAFLLKIIVAANSFYALLSIYFVINYFEQLSILGIAYFFIEKIILLCVICIEMKTINKI